MKKIILNLALIFVSSIGMAQVFSTTTANISFFSSTSVEDIQAENVNVLSVFNTKGEIAFMVNNTGFNFPNKLMQEHFNEKYMESDKYPTSTFKGKINQVVDYSKDGEYEVSVSGKLNIHGVETARTIPGSLIIKDGAINLKSEFKVKVADHKITIPNLVVTKIAEDILVKVNATLLPKK